MNSSLHGKRIVITRAPHQAGELADLLHERGAETLLYPCIEVAPLEDTSLLDPALQAAARGKFDWLILTSSNTVETLARRFTALELNAANFQNLHIAAVGSATAEAAIHAALHVDFVPDEYHGEALAKALSPEPLTRILLPQADIAPSTLARSIESLGAQVCVVTAYRTIMGSGGVHLPILIQTHKIDAILFTSSSTVTNFMVRFTNEGGDFRELHDITFACLGSSTLKTAHEKGLHVDVVPPVPTLINMIHSLEDYYA